MGRVGIAGDELAGPLIQLHGFTIARLRLEFLGDKLTDITRYARILLCGKDLRPARNSFGHRDRLVFPVRKIVLHKLCVKFPTQSPETSPV